VPVQSFSPDAAGSDIRSPYPPNGYAPNGHAPNGYAPNGEATR
jgi:hypothetical protein